ncbi:50S ribosomal protein L25/general stress protein Ctc [Humidisolicoccus flavus]|uniref:50S ribosomal protein L25/general stress protein Ctc n=1 Tax=Humidisolicoccus flavus TaxID=3111414 RepID=UPI0032455F6D
MSENATLSAEVRTAFGKGAARKIRAIGKIPAVLYGHGSEPQHLTLPGHEVMLLVRRSNAIIELDIEGKDEVALVKDVQRDPVRQIIEHVDLVIVRRGEKVTVDVPVHVEGESAPGTISNLENTTLQVEVEAMHIPESITVSIEGLEEGAQIHAGDVKLPKGATLLADPELLVVGIATPAAPVLEDEDAESTEASAETAEESEEAAE